MVCYAYDLILFIHTADMSRTLDFPLIDSIHVQNQLGEGIIWEHRLQCFYWTDIQAQQLCKLTYPSGELNVWDLPYRLASFGLTEDTERLIVAFEDAVGLLCMTSGEVEWLFQGPFEETSLLRFNDGRVSPAGDFYVASMNESTQPDPLPNGAVFQVDGKGNYRTVINNVTIGNGLCWSADSKSMFFADSAAHTITRYCYDSKKRTISNPEKIITTATDHFPDGACCDSNGGLWSAVWGGSAVRYYQHDGQLLGELSLPVSQPTCVCIGGPNLDILVVTSAKDGLSENQITEQCGAGDIYFYQLPEPIGKLESIFSLAPTACE